MTPEPTAAAWVPDRALLEALSDAAFAIAPDRRLAGMNRAGVALAGAPCDQLLGSDAVTALFRDGAQGPTSEVMAHALRGHRWSGELPFGRLGHEDRRSLTLTPVVRDDRVEGVLLLVGDGIAPTRERAAHHFARLARVASELIFAETMDAVTEVVIEHLADEANATVASLSVLVDDDTLGLVGLRGAREGAAARWATYSVHAHTPASEAVRTGLPVVLVNRGEIERRFPDLESAAAGERAIVCLPLRTATRTIGVISLSFPGGGGLDPAMLEFFGVMADTCAQSIDRVQARAESADQATRLRYLAEASAALASSLDYEVTLRRVADMAVPWFADWCAISLEQDGLLRTLAVAHVDPDKVALARELQRRFPPDPDADSGSYRVLRTGQSELIPEVTDEMLRAVVRDPEQLELVRALNFRSAMTVPLRTESRTLGVATWVAGEGGRRFGPADLELGEDLARRAAIAIDNAELHSEQKELATLLQQAVLPAGLPESEGWSVTAEYHPAGRTEAGGDFYDAVALDSDRMALFVGDVMGRGVKAAATMAQMRSAIRTLIALDPAPEVLFARLDTLFDHLAVEELVTVAYAVADRRHGILTVVSAGHPPPLVVPREAAPLLVEARGRLLGAGHDVRRPVTVPFAPGDLVLLFTDGLVERRGEDLDLGLGRLVSEAGGLRRAEVAQALTELIADLRDPTRDDDIAALVLRSEP